LLPVEEISQRGRKVVMEELRPFEYVRDGLAACDHELKPSDFPTAHRLFKVRHNPNQTLGKSGKKRLTILAQAVIYDVYAAGYRKNMDERRICEVGRRQGTRSDALASL
jgi:hypothetical protein